MLVPAANEEGGESVLTFQYEGHTYDMLEDLDLSRSDQILKGCEMWGLDVLIVADESAAMKGTSRRGVGSSIHYGQIRDVAADQE